MNKDKLKDILGTIVQIVFIAVIIMAIMLFVQNKLNSSRDSSDSENATVVGDDSDNSSKDSENDSSGYTIEVNKKKNAVIVYQKQDDSKVAVKVMRCSVGPDTPTGTFEIMESYTWISATDVYWNKYSCRFDEKFWFQSADYFAPYNSYISVDSYNAIGTTQEEGGCIKLTVEDAKWIYDNCPSGTKVKIVKGKKSDELPMDFAEFTELPYYGGWDPTDPDEDNPWRNMANETIAANSSVVYIERGSNVNYLSNVIALDSDGTNVTESLKYKTFDSNETGTYTVNYSYTCSSGVNMKNTITYEVIDTLGPTISFTSTDEDDFIYKINKEKFKKKLEKSGEEISLDDYVTEQINTEEFCEKIIKKMKKLIEAVDIDTEISSSRIVVILPDELKLGDNQIKYSVADDFDNVSYVIVTLNIKYDDEEDESEEESTEEITEENTEESTEKSTEDVTKKTEKKTTKNTKDTTKSKVKNTTKAAETKQSTTQNTTKPTEQSTDDSNNTNQDDNIGEESAGD